MNKRSFRMVCEKERRESVKNLLAAENFTFEEEAFSDCCFRLTNSPFPLGSSLAAFFGYIYIQDRSSMLPALVLSPPQNTLCLDMCASPGGKATFLAQLAGKNSFILANEANHERTATLLANIRKLNLFNMGVSRYHGKDLPLRENSINSILLDPPCSGWGTAKKNPSTLKIWRGHKIAPLRSLQKQLLQKAAHILAPGGRLVYSTCTTNPEENEKQVQFAQRELGLETISIAPPPGFVFDAANLEKGHLLVDGEASHAQGFFIALLRKAGNAIISPEDTESSADTSMEFCNFPLPSPGKVQIVDGKARFISEASQKLPQNIRWQGPPLGAWREGAGFRPDLRLRYNALMTQNNLPRMVFEEVSQVRYFLSGQEIKTDMESGLASLWWRDLPLGLGRVRGKRLINSWK